jgi:hypothetical protein
MPIKKYRFPKPAQPPLERINDVLDSAPLPKRVNPSDLIKEPSFLPANPHPVEEKLNTPAISSQVHKVAPLLATKATPGAYNMHRWEALIPNTFRCKSK